MKKSTLLVVIIYFLVAVSDILFIYLEQPDYRWFSKPLLIPLLLIAFYIEISKPLSSIAYFIISALFFSWCGDVFLQAEGFFIPGLVSFLLAHICYILYFRKLIKGVFRMLIIIPVVIYLSAFTIYLFPYLRNLKIPVIFYSLTIGTMLIMAFHIKDSNSRNFASWFCYGALFFVISDSILALNLFVVKLEMLGLAVMTTYVLAQVMIVKGAMLHFAKKI